MRSANYENAIQESFYFLEDAGITEFPLDFAAVFNALRTNVKVKTYSEFAEDQSIPFEQCKKMFGSDGVSVYDATHEKYLIIYNETRPPKRIRFTLGHELGHIILSHHAEVGTNILERSELDDSTYETVFEGEANWFSRSLLAPTPSVVGLLEKYGFENKGWSSGHYNWECTKETDDNKNLRRNFSADMYVEVAYGLSSSAAEIRVEKLETEAKKIRSKKMDYKYVQGIRHRAKWYCSRCSQPRSKSAVFCTNCGRRAFDFGIPERNGYLKVRGTNGRIKKCPICGNDEFSVDAQFCRVCGSPLMNLCTNAAARHPNHPQSRYCAICGKETMNKDTEMQLRIEKEGRNAEEWDKMIYDDGVPFDLDTFRVQKCPRCGNEEFSSSAVFCRACGLELYNPCISEKIDEDDWGNPIMSQSHNNPSNARFCEQCGRQTVYFAKHKLLRPYTVVLEEKEFEVPF